MRIHFLGGASEVGASCVVIEAGGRRVLVDAGVRPGAADPLPDLARLQEGSGIDAVVVTHAHADHIGALPLAVAAFPAAPVVATPATLGLMTVMLSDAVRIGQQRAVEGGDLPPYGQGAVDALLARVRPLGVHQPLTLLPAEGDHGAWTLTFCPAGHVLGAAMALLETPEGSVLVSGDVSFALQRTVGPAVPPRRKVDVLILESTYGNRLHSSRAAEEERLIEQIGAVLSRGGHCLIPAFALGRAQEVLLILREARAQGRLPGPVWVDGLVRSVCTVYHAHAGSTPARLQRLIAREGNPFVSSEGPVRAVASPEERRAVLQGPPAVIVSSSGMLLGGPSAYYAAELAGDARHALLITGYQDEEAPGKKLLDLADAPPGTRRLAVGGREVEVQAEVRRYSLSAHADGDELAALAERVQPRLTLLVHGDAEARSGLAGKLLDLRLMARLPATGETVEIAARPVRRGHRPLPAPAAPPPTAEALVVLMAGGSVQGAGAGRRTGGGWTALALAARHDGGAVTPEGVEAMTTLLRAQDRFFAPDSAREGVWRLTDQGQKLAARLLAHEGGERQPADQETVRTRLADLFGSDATYVRGSLYPQERRAVLRFHFPQVAGGRHADALALIAEETGWSVTLRQEPDMEALVQMVTAVLPDDVALVARPSVHHETRGVDVRLDRALNEEERAAVERRYQEETGYTVRLSGPTVAATSPGPDEASPAAAPGMAQRVDAQTAIGAVRVALQAAGAEVYRVGQHGDRLQVTYLTPVLASRYQAVLSELAERTGWPITVDLQPQQQALIEVVRAVVRAPLAKGPGVHAARQRVSVRLAPGAEPAGEDRAAWQEAVQDRTGYELEFL